MLLTIVSFIITIGVIITVHEFGHFLAARLTGMRVKKFSIGFPPKMISRTIGNTEFILSWIPLGGYVQIAGMVDESLEGEEVTGAPDEFMSKNPPQKVFVLSAGVILNYLTAFLIIAGLAATLGMGEISGTRVGEVMSGMPAEAAGIVAGDQIISVNGSKTQTWEELVEAVGGSADTVHLLILRVDGSEWSTTVPTQAAG
ncbi:site-2 protease family protein, partial [bacterium]|nr:site-2 protease family protein [bacterium]